ncbi:MAG: PQQ-dependent sugar dehydrogenase [Armatimonadetes bacterium]|nr:PQQ-dependent sugar dehydrogenase [Akkermansiaceae bacterium]
MKRSFPPFGLLLIFASTGLCELKTELLHKGLTRPVWAGAPDSVKGKLWVMEQAGTVWIIDLKTGQRSEKPFLEIKDQVDSRDNEEGLLGLAFAPDFAKSGRYYVNFTDPDSQIRIVRFVSKDGETTNVASSETILEFHHDFGNHNGGWMDFGHDGM